MQGTQLRERGGPAQEVDVEEDELSGGAQVDDALLSRAVPRSAAEDHLRRMATNTSCLLYTSDAADDTPCVDL
eukprot:3790941-Pleurochrysis_carterae.AAC.2